jgi:hypothetical protein
MNNETLFEFMNDDAGDIEKADDNNSQKTKNRNTNIKNISGL